MLGARKLSPRPPSHCLAEGLAQALWSPRASVSLLHTVGLSKQS